MDPAGAPVISHLLETLKLELSTSATLLVEEVVRVMAEAMMVEVEATQPPLLAITDFIMARDSLQDRDTVKLES
jgi:hypothetical protein